MRFPDDSNYTYLKQMRLYYSKTVQPLLVLDILMFLLTFIQ
jgi:hypothetical protein